MCSVRPKRSVRTDEAYAGRTSFQAALDLAGSFGLELGGEISIHPWDSRYVRVRFALCTPLPPFKEASGLERERVALDPSSDAFHLVATTSPARHCHGGSSATAKLGTFQEIACRDGE